MKILIVSDTHRRTDHLERALERTGEIDMLIHLGDVEGSQDYIEVIADCPTYIVAGNNDYYSDLPSEEIVQIGRYRAFLTHGHYYDAFYGTERLKDEARARGAQIVMFGHTHYPLIDRSGDVTAVNPGSLTYPRQEGRRPSYIIMEIDRFGEAHFTVHYL